MTVICAEYASPGSLRTLLIINRAWSLFLSLLSPLLFHLSPRESIEALPIWTPSGRPSPNNRARWAGKRLENFIYHRRAIIYRTIAAALASVPVRSRSWRTFCLMSSTVFSLESSTEVLRRMINRICTNKIRDSLPSELRQTLTCIWIDFTTRFRNYKRVMFRARTTIVT